MTCCERYIKKMLRLFPEIGKRFQIVCPCGKHWKHVYHNGKPGWEEC